MKRFGPVVFSALVFVLGGHAIAGETGRSDQVPMREDKGFKEVPCNWEPGMDDQRKTVDFGNGAKVTTFPPIYRDRTTGKCFMSISSDDIPKVTPLK
jgi:hypothetical protein